jgi:hypothetical protein
MSQKLRLSRKQIKIFELFCFLFWMQNCKYLFASFDVTGDAVQHQVQTLSVPYLVIVENNFAVLRPLLGWLSISNFPSCLLIG